MLRALRARISAHPSLKREGYRTLGYTFRPLANTSPCSAPTSATCSSSYLRTSSYLCTSSSSPSLSSSSFRAFSTTRRTAQPHGPPAQPHGPHPSRRPLAEQPWRWPTPADCRDMPRRYCEMSNEALLILASHGDSGAITEVRGGVFVCEREREEKRRNYQVLHQ